MRERGKKSVIEMLNFLKSPKGSQAKSEALEHFAYTSWPDERTDGHINLQNNFNTKKYDLR